MSGRVKQIESTFRKLLRDGDTAAAGAAAGGEPLADADADALEEEEEEEEHQVARQGFLGVEFPE